MKKEKVSIIIPAFNEKKRISSVLDVAIKARKKIEEIIEVIVVDDGSNDNTREEAKEKDINKLIVHKENKGKGEALKSGIKKAEGDILFFLDADLINFKLDHIKKVLEPILSKDYIMVNGVLDRGKQFTDITGENDFTNKLAPLINNYNSSYIGSQITGIRTITREVWNKTPNVRKFYIDKALYETAKKIDKNKIKNVVLFNVLQHSKPQKRGPKGHLARFKMWGEIAFESIRYKIKNLID